MQRMISATPCRSKSTPVTGIKAWDGLIEQLGKDPFMKKVMDSQKAWVKRVVYYGMLNSADYRVAYEHHFAKLPL